MHLASLRDVSRYAACAFDQGRTRACSSPHAHPLDHGLKSPQQELRKVILWSLKVPELSRWPRREQPTARGRPTRTRPTDFACAPLVVLGPPSGAVPLRGMGGVRPEPRLVGRPLAELHTPRRGARPDWGASTADRLCLCPFGRAWAPFGGSAATRHGGRSAGAQLVGRPLVGRLLVGRPLVRRPSAACHGPTARMLGPNGPQEAAELHTPRRGARPEGALARPNAPCLVEALPQRGTGKVGRPC